MFASEWNIDAQALATDGQYWRSVYGGSRLVLGGLRCEPSLWVVFRLLAATCLGILFYLEEDLHPFNQDWMRTFGHWTLIVQTAYFGLSAGLTTAAACSNAPGIARTTPTIVRITELCYGIVLPASLISFLIQLLIQFSQEKWCVSRIEIHIAHTGTECIYTAAALILVAIDTGFSRQPYYASFHALAGVFFSWGYLLYNVLWEVLGGRNLHGQTYIYRCLDWSYPLQGGGHNAAGKMMFLNLFIVIPVANYLYWLLIWARRRVMNIDNASKQLKGSEREAKGDTATPLRQRRKLIEWGADMRDLHLDGKHWRAQVKTAPHSLCFFRQSTLTLPFSSFAFA